MTRRVLGILPAVIFAVACQGAAPQSQLNTRVRDFVTPTYVHGVPYDDARALGPQALPILEQLLRDPSMVRHRRNIIITIGMIGTPAAQPVLITFVQNGSGELSAQEVSLRVDALLALGYAANTSTDLSELTYLRNGLDNASWAAPRVQWTLPGGASPAARLRLQAINSLGLTGKPQADQALVQLQVALKSSGGGRGGAPPSSEEALVAQAIQTNQFLLNNSLSAYFKQFPR
jgi:hypothetical protein